MRKTEARSVSGIDRVQLRDIGEVHITQGDFESLSVEADEKVLPKIKTDVIDGCLVISIGGDRLSLLGMGLKQLTSGLIRFKLQVRQLSGVDVPGAGTVRAEKLSSPALKVRLAGAGAIELGGLSVGKLTVELAGAGKIELEGAAESQDVHLSGAGSYQGVRMETRRGKVNVSGVGGATVNVQEELDVTISGLGGVQYKGAPKMQTSISGMGRLTKIEE